MSEKTCAVLVGIGPNDVEIPALIFPDFKTGLEKCKEFLGEPTGISGDKTYWNVDELQACEEDEDYEEMKDFDMITLELVEENGVYKKQIGNKPFNSTKVYTSYYGGCGEFYSLELREVEFGKPFVCWDLD